MTKIMLSLKLRMPKIEENDEKYPEMQELPEKYYNKDIR